MRKTVFRLLVTASLAAAVRSPIDNIDQLIENSHSEIESHNFAAAERDLKAALAQTQASRDQADEYIVDESFPGSRNYKVKRSSPNNGPSRDPCLLNHQIQTSA